jgi:hypothetical protein
MKRYEVVNVRTGDRFGNHTHADATSRAQIMRRNWNYRESFAVEEIMSAEEFERSRKTSNK